MQTNKLHVGGVGVLENSWKERINFAEVVQVIDGQNLLAEVGEQIVWMSGLNTAGLVDKSRLSVGGKCWEVTRTRKYDTVIGAARTLFELSLYDTKPAVADANARLRGTIRVEEPREFTFLEPESKVLATFVTFANGKVTLRKEDGSVITVPIMQLAREDREWVRDEMGRRPKPAAGKPPKKR